MINIFIFTEATGDVKDNAKRKQIKCVQKEEMELF